jgi:SLIT-ROBO Rho GTPase activating protein
MDFGFHQSLTRAIMMHVSGMEQKKRHVQQDVDALNKTLSGLDSRLDKQRFIESNNTTFMIPKKFEYTPVRRDESETLVQKTILDELEIRKQSLLKLLKELKTESEEIWKSMETAEKTLSEMVGCNDFDTTRFFVEEDKTSLRESDTLLLKQKSDRKETEEFYTMVSNNVNIRKYFIP